MIFISHLLSCFFSVLTRLFGPVFLKKIFLIWKTKKIKTRTVRYALEHHGGGGNYLYPKGGGNWESFRSSELELSNSKTNIRIWILGFSLRI